MSTVPKELAHLQIPLEKIVKATNNFADENYIRNSGYGPVYKGSLFWQGQLIEIDAEKLDRSRPRGDIWFWTDVSLRFSLKHRNVVSIVGFCDENDEMIVISKHETRGTLYRYLNGTSTLTWSQRLRICVGVAHAVSYLHYDESRDFSVIHRTICAPKILLDHNWEPKITGFGLSLKVPATRRNRIHLSPLCGIPGYVDPTYNETGSVTHKSDLYSFGLVLFEVMCNRIHLIAFDGRPPTVADMDEDHRHLGPIARSHYEEEKLDEIIDPGLRKQMDPESLKIFSETAYCCLKMRRAERPNINQIVTRLQKALELQLKSENIEHSTVDTEVEGTSLDSRKWKHLEHLRIGLNDIKRATNNFAEKYCIGSGGYGMVYEAELEQFNNTNSTAVEGNINEPPKKRNTVAIKRIINREDKQGEHGFIAEVETLTSCKHRNIISLLGFCDESSEMILIYEHASNGSLSDYLGNIDNMTNLIWAQRLQMCLEIAQGLNYLHTKDVQRIIHRDIKSDNILLDHNWVPKIADFGLSKFGPASQQVSYLESTNVAGTNYYLDPEYMNTGKLKIESDIYSFGVVLFEILSGKLAYDPFYIQKNDKGLAPIARQHFDMGTLMEIVDLKIKEEVDENTFTLSKGPNQDSLDTFFKIAHQCLAETQAQRPKMKTVIMELEKALNFQENGRDNLQISLQDIKSATQDFSPTNLFGEWDFGRYYEGEVVGANGRTTSILAKRLDRGTAGEGEAQFFMELEVLFEYKHENIIGLVGYVNEADEKIIVYEGTPKGGLSNHVKDASLTWTKRLKIGIDVANGLDFLHGGVVAQDVVIHRDIQSGVILLNGEWKALISGFVDAIIMPKSKEIDFVVKGAVGASPYIDPLYWNTGFLSRESDIYSFGVVLSELLCGRLAYNEDDFSVSDLIYLVKSHYEEGKLDELVFEGIREQIVPQSLITFQNIAYQCLHENREERPSAKKVAEQLKKALEFQEDHEIWEPKLPREYKEIIQLSKTPDVFYSIEKKKDLYDMLSKGILIQEGKVWFSLSNNGEKNELISARMFSYENRTSLKWKSIKKSRFPVVVRMMNISDLQIQIEIEPQFLSPNVIYGAYLVFKFCDPRKFSNQPMYVNLKYKMGSKTLHAYFGRWREDGWMMIELCRFLHYKDNARFEVMLESFSRYYCGSGVLYVEGIEFRAIDDSSLKVKPEVQEKPKDEVRTVMKSNSEIVKPEVSEKQIVSQRVLRPNSVCLQQLTVDSSTITKHEQGEKLFSLSKPEEKKSHMLPAKLVLFDAFNVTCIKMNWKSLTESRFVDVAELLSHQEFRIKCKIETRKLSPDTDYACHLIFKLSQKCHGLQCPIKVQDVLLRKNKESKFLYFRTPSSINLHDAIRFPKLRKDGLMEVIVWEFNSSNKLIDDHRLMHLKLRCYEGTMRGLVVYGVDFRPI